MKQENELLKKVQELNIGKHYNEVIELLPIEILEKYRNAKFYSEKAKAYWNTKQHELCKLMAEESIKLEKNNIISLQYLGHIYIDLKKYKKAVEQYNKAIEIEPLNASNYNGLGNAYNNLKEFDKAIQQYRRAVEIEPQYIKPYFGLGNTYKNKKEFGKAIENYKKAIEINPTHAPSHNGLASVYTIIKVYEKAIEYYKKAIEINPKYAPFFYGLGNVYYHLKEFDYSIAQYKKALEINPNYAAPYYGLGVVYYYLKNNDKAIEQCKKAIEIDAEFIEAYNGLGNAYKQIKEFDNAIKQYRKIIKIDPKYSTAYNGLGNVYYDLKDYEKALKLYKKTIEIDPQYYGAYWNIGLVYYDLKEYQNAIVHYRIYIDLEPNKSNFYYKNAQSKIEEIEKILANHNYKVISSKIDAIKKLLLFKGDCITHYTSISTVEYLILNESPLRLSEGSFLNDTSEGQELFQFLEINNNTNNRQTEENFTKRPFIGSFVDAAKNNDLTLWRMYGKEELEEAKGCSITINAKALKDSINNKISPKFDGNSTTTDDIEFYRVAYRKGDTFDFADSNPETCKNLMELMKELKKEVKKFNTKKDKTKKEEIEIIELLNEVAYLFKSIEYQYENEIRLVIKEGIGFDKKIDFNPKDFKTSTEPFKVYIELVPILNLLSVITIGPKVNKAEEWAATFHYHLANQNFKPEIHISKLPFK